MEYLLFVVLGVTGGAIAGFAITYFTFVGKLQKKLASAKKKLDRAQGANEETETLQSQLEAQKYERQAAESKLQSLETAHQAKIDELEAELASLRQSSIAPDQILPDNSEALAALQAQLEEVEQQHQATLQDQLEEVEQQHQATLQSRLAEVEQQHQDALQTLESRHESELESLRKSLTFAPPTPAVEAEPELPESDQPDQGNWGAAAIAGGAAAIGAGMAALSNFGQSSPPESDEQDFVLENFPPDLGLEDLVSETPELIEEDFAIEEIEEIDHSPFDEPEDLDAGAFSEIPIAEAAEVADTEDLSPFAPPGVPIEVENWVDAPDLDFAGEAEVEDSDSDAFSEETGRDDGFSEGEVLADLGTESFSSFELSPELGIDGENWVDAPDNLDLDLIGNELDLDLGEPPADLLPDFSEPLDTGRSDVDDLLSEGGDDGAFGAELPDMGAASDMDLGLELPDMTEEPAQDLGEFGFGNQNLEEQNDEIPDGDELLAELTGTDAGDTGLDLFTLEEPSAATEAFFEEDLSLPSNPGSTLEMPDSFLADIPSFIPESDAEDISEMEAGGDDDLDFLLQLQEDEPPSFPGGEFLPEFNDDDPLGSSFPTMELVADDNSELSDLLGEVRPTYGGDPYINILDESPDSTDNDLLALLQNEEGGDDPHHEGDDDLFSGLEGMLNTDTPDNESDLDDLDALLSTSGDSGMEQGDVFSLEDLGFGEEKY